MAVTEPRIIFGVHSVAPYSRTTGKAYGLLKVIKDSSLSLQGELISLTGGSNKYEWAVEDGKVTAEMALKFAEYPNFVYELFLGKAVTVNAADASGFASTATNKNGTSLVSVAGITGVTVLAGSEADLKFGKYIIEVVSATTVHVYTLSDVDITRGADGTLQTDDGRITASALTITATADTTIPNFGLKLTGAAGPIAMTIGDTAEFEVRPVNTGGSIDVIIGASSDRTPEFGCVMVAQQRSNGQMFEIDAFKCKASGLPFGLAEKSFSEIDAKAKLLFDPVKNGVFRQRHCSP